MGDRYKASIDGYALEMETISDTLKKAIAKYRYPYRDGAETEDMGQEAWEVRLRCYFLEETYDSHYEFKEHLKSRDLFELSHPKYGIKKGRIENISIRHDDREDTAEIDISFIEDIESQESAVETYSMDVSGESEEAFTDGVDERKTSFEDAAKEAIGSDANDIVDAELDEDSGIVEQYPGVSTSTRTWLKAVEKFVTTLQATAVDATNPANSLISMIDYGADLPGRVIGALDLVAERYAVLYETLKDSPPRYLRNIKNSIADLADTVEELFDTGSTSSQSQSDNVEVFSGMVQAAGAQRLALEAATLYADDEEARNLQRQREENTTGSFDVEGNYIPRDEVPTVLTVQELEQSLAVVRTELQTALDADRTLTTMKELAKTLLEHVNTIKLERDRMVTITLDNPMPLLAVCMMRGLSIDTAERLLAINDIENPNFVSGEITVYA